MLLTRPCLFVSALVLLGLPSCEAVSHAPQGSPRVELEVALVVDPSYSGKLQGHESELVSALDDLVLRNADVGLRFYPVPSSNYGASDPHPEYLMRVTVRDLDVDLQYRTTQKKGEDPVLETTVDQIKCGVTALISKRRDRGPDLTVARTRGEGVAHVGSQEEGGEPIIYKLRRGDSAHPEDLPVPHKELLLATERALQAALAQLVEPVDRDLALAAKAAAPAQEGGGKR